MNDQQTNVDFTMHVVKQLNHKLSKTKSKYKVALRDIPRNKYLLIQLVTANPDVTPKNILAVERATGIIRPIHSNSKTILHKEELGNILSYISLDLVARFLNRIDSYVLCR